MYFQKIVTLFLYIELTADRPLPDLRLFRFKTFTMANIMQIVATIGLYVSATVKIYIK